MVRPALAAVGLSRDRRHPRPVSGERRRLTILNWSLAVVLVVWSLASLVLFLLHAADLRLLDEAGYGDSYILYDVQHFRQTGVIYRDLAQPPYLPTQYSPMVYVLYSLPSRMAEWENPFVGPRLVALLSFSLCLCVVISTVRTLLPRWTSGWAVLLTCSLAVAWDWLLQLRGDFPGIFLSLLAIRLLLSRARAPVALAGVCAGLAMHFKIVFVAALTAGALWLLVQRRWKDLAKFAGCGVVTSAGLYWFFATREPRMLPQMFALSPGVADTTQWVTLTSLAGQELVALLAMVSVSSVACRGSRWNLVLVFAVISFVLGGVFVLQAGGNVNYFFEALLAAVPLAVLGSIRLVALARRDAIVTVAAAAFLLIFYCAPRTLEAYRLLHARWVTGSDSVASRNQTFTALEQALRGAHLLSTIPRVALFDAEPALMEPFLLTYMERLGKVDPRPLLDRIHNSEFDVVVTKAQFTEWRGLPHIARDLHTAIAASYRPHCAMRDVIMHLPEQPRGDNSAIVRNLAARGCLSVRLERSAVPR